MLALGLVHDEFLKKLKDVYLIPQMKCMCSVCSVCLVPKQKDFLPVLQWQLKMALCFLSTEV